MPYPELVPVPSEAGRCMASRLRRHQGFAEKGTIRPNHLGEPLQAQAFT